MNDYLNRRDILRAGLVLGAGLAIPGHLLAADQPQVGGVLSLAITSDPPSYDPLSATASFVINVVAPCYNGLVRYAPNDPEAIIGDLAESWTVSEDGRQVTFILRQGVSFHDGKPFTADDVKFTFDMVRNPPADRVSVRKDLLANVADIIVVDPHTVRFDLTSPQSAFLQILAMGWMVVLPKHVLELPDGVSTQIVGTGPFKFKSHQQGVSVELVKNEAYHEAGLPYLDGLTFYVLPDRSTSFAYLRTGQLHMIDGMDGEDARRVQEQFGDVVAVQQVPSYSYSNILLNSSRAPFDDIRVREAVSLAINRQEALDVLRQGFGVTGSLMPPGKWALTPEALGNIAGNGPDHSANLARARELLAEAGLADGFEVKMTTRRQGVFEAQAVWIQSALEPLGIRLPLDLQESAAFFDTLNSGNFDIAPYARTIDVNDPSAVFGGIHACDSALNYSHACASQLEELLAADLAATSDEERQAIAAKMNEVVLGEFGEIPLFWRDRFLPVSRKVHNVVLHPSPDNNRRFDTVWMER